MSGFAKHALTATLLISTMLTGLTGCSSSVPTNYYLLSAEASEAKFTNPELALTVGPVYLADYLNRQGMVSRDSDVAYQIHDDELWAGQLDTEIALIVKQNLATLTGSEHLRSFGVVGMQPQHSIRITVDRFDASSDGAARLQGSWQLLSATHQELKHQAFSFSEIAATGTEGKVQAYSQLLLQLSEQIASALAQMPLAE
ncbi:membrane integrity-associated transporter subunit PqiC [Corallincola platygyrae]